MKKRILLCIGTRADALKMAPLALKLREDGEVECVVLCTGQHREMCREALSVFSVTPDIDLDIMEREQTLEHIEEKLREKFPPVLENVRPELVLVHGDTASARWCAEMAHKAGIKIAHIEAGVRSHDLNNPYPEEGYRRYISSVAAYHFAPTDRCRENLRSEGVFDGSIFTVGNTVIDALCMAREKAKASDVRLPRSPYILLTCHRRESRGERAREIFRAADRICGKYPSYSVLFPMHKSEAVHLDFSLSGISAERFFVCEPLEYPSFIKAMECSDFIISDSGGVIEEASYLGKPVIVAREASDRPEAQSSGSAMLSGTDGESIVSLCERLICDRAFYAEKCARKFAYGDGHASDRICEKLYRLLH